MMGQRSSCAGGTRRTALRRRGSLFPSVGNQGNPGEKIGEVLIIPIYLEFFFLFSPVSFSIFFIYFFSLSPLSLSLSHSYSLTNL